MNPRARAIAFASACALALSCSAPAAQQQAPPAASCPDGHRPTPDGACVWLRPDGPCPAGTMALLGQETCAPVGWTECPNGFEKSPDGWGCRDVQSEAPCPAGTMPRLGSRDCAPVGQTACPAGFERDASGWGCREVLPASDCTGFTRPALGQRSCVPIGDCAAPFPPAAATVFVDPTFPSTDATHFRTIGAAVAAAPAGATIALAPGTYREAVRLARAVTLVGKCAAEVRVQGGSGAGLALDGVTGATVRGVTIGGSTPGLVAGNGAELVLEDVLLDANVGTGLIALDRGAAGPTRVTLRRSSLRGTVPSSSTKPNGVVAFEGSEVHVEDSAIEQADGTLINVQPSSSDVLVKLVRSVLRRPASAAGDPVGATISAGTLSLEDSAVVDLRNAGVAATAAAAVLTLKGTTVRGTRSTASGSRGWGVYATKGGKATVESSTLLENAALGIALEEGASVRLTGSTVFSSVPCTAAGAACGGVLANSRATLEVEDSAEVGGPRLAVTANAAGTRLTFRRSLVQGARGVAGATSWGDPLGIGLGCSTGASMTVEASAVVGSESAGVAVLDGCTASVLDTIVRDGVAKLSGGVANGIIVSEKAKLVARRCAIVGNEAGGLRVEGTDPPTSPPTPPGLATVSETVVRDPAPAREVLAVGLFARFGGILVADHVSVVHARGFGVVAGKVGSLVELSSADVRDPTLFGDDTGMDGVPVLALQGGTVKVSDAAVLGGNGLGAATMRLSRLALTRTLVAETHREATGGFGYGVLAQAGDAVSAVACELRDNAVGLVVAGGAATLDGSIVRRHAVALHAQGGTALEESAQPPGEPVQGKLIVGVDNVFDANDARVGTGDLPLPKEPKL